MVAPCVSELLQEALLAVEVAAATYPNLAERAVEVALSYLTELCLAATMVTVAEMESLQNVPPVHLTLRSQEATKEAEAERALCCNFLVASSAYLAASGVVVVGAMVEEPHLVQAAVDGSPALLSSQEAAVSSCLREAVASSSYLGDAVSLRVSA
jgi:hypothetical protein